MSFDFIAWLKCQAGPYELDIPCIDVSNKTADDKREWLIANGLGSFASGNIWGANTRRYHGLGVFALQPPGERTVILSRLDEVADGVPLSTNLWTSGAVNPGGYRNAAAFTIYPVPTWLFQLPGGYLIKQVGMLPGKQEVIVGYTWTGQAPLHLTLKVLVNCRDFHAETRGSNEWRFLQDVQPSRVKMRAYASAPELTVAFSRGLYVQEPCWYWNYYWPREHERGLGFREDCFHAGRLEVSLEPGASVTLHAGLDSALLPGSIDQVVRDVALHHNHLIALAGWPVSQDARRLVLAADQFLSVRQSTASETIVAGYHWFADWGRDSMVSLPGLALATGRYNIASGILKTFGQYLSEGMLPNNFPDSGRTPHYNTIDATFWWAWALLKYYQNTSDDVFVSSQLPLLEDVVTWHLKGTRYNIHVDPADGLVSGGQPDVQLTWMDAKVGDYVVTPRSGKAVEINALWFNFLKILEHLLSISGGDGTKFGAMAETVRVGFQSFWNGEAGCLYDVIREDGWKDGSVRPNQLLAISLPYKLVTREQAKSILTKVEAELLTPVGLRSLSPKDPAYKGNYGGGKDVANQFERDITYHQGTVWPWLLGPWVDARMKIHGNGEDNRRLVANQLATIRRHILGEAGLGTISEIFDGNQPHSARGCIAQAWSVAELLRVFTEYNL